MFKKYVAVFTVVFLFITMLPSVLIEKAYAYQNNAYFNDLRVGLTSMASTSLSTTLNGSYTVNGQSYPAGTVLNLSINGTSINFNGTLLNQVNITSNDKTNLLTLTAGTISNKYMGSFLIKVLDGKLLPINYIDMENYLKGVVGYEMSDYFPIEALKAQAVAARNYALSRIGWENVKGFDFDDTISYQVYKGYNPNYTRVISAVEQTSGQVLLYNDKLVETLYSAWHGGVSEDSENVWGNVVPYLRSVQDSFENDSWPNGNRVLTNAQIQSTLVARKYLATTDTFLRLDLNSITRYKSGRVANINIVYKNSLGTELTKSVIRDNTRTFLGLPSNMYTVSYDTAVGAYTFSGRGNGHGLGLSQIGAKNRASAGQTHDQILKFYFQNSYLQNLIAKASLSAVNLSNSTAFVGEKVTYSAVASGGNGYGYLYKYVIKNASSIAAIRDYSSDSSYEFAPGSQGSYSVEVYVKDKFSISEYDDYKNAAFTVYEKPILSNITLNKQEGIVGQSVIADASMQGGSGSYLYKYDIVKDGVLVTTREFSAEKQFAFIPEQEGLYSVNLYVKDSISANTYDLTQTQNFIAYKSLSIDSLSIDNSTVSIGGLVNLNANISGGSGKGIRYKYVITKDGQNVFTADYSADSSFTYVTDKVGNYEAEVYVVDLASDNNYDVTNKISFTVIDKASVAALTINKTAAMVNDNIVANATSSSANSLYKFIATNGGVVVRTQEYSSINIFEFSAIVEGEYSIEVYVKDAASRNDFDDRRSIVFAVYKPQLGTVTATGNFYEGKIVNFSANSIGASPYGFEYKYEVMSAGKPVAYNGFNTSGGFSFIPTDAGEYTIIVYGKDSLSTKLYDSVKQFIITVASKPLYLSKLPLKQGMSGSDVSSLQSALISLGYSISKEPGYFGTQTKNAVISFQKSKNLAADGIVGNMTYGALNDALIEKAGIRSLTN